MTRQILGNIESGRRKVYHWHIRGIRNALHCTFDEIFLGPKVNGAAANAFLKQPRKRKHH
ncbi:MAG: hypothetical protein L0Z50_07620 [Verrucomicrobiales bacterium]|nr:hypothetical protein [Verrucomicrobiales bacterium]